VADFTLKQHDTRPKIQVALAIGGAEADLTTATSVTFIMAPAAGGAATVDAAATILDAATGSVSYDWAAGDTDDVGSFDAEFEVVWSDGTKQTFPTATYISIEIVADLDGS
jgi:hypothetical protein